MNKEKQVLEEFEKSCENIKVKTNLDNDTLLILYGLFKQATIGDCNISKPGFFDMKGQAKWNAWNDNKNMDKQTAMKRYIRKVKSILD